VQAELPTGLADGQWDQLAAVAVRYERHPGSPAAYTAGCGPALFAILIAHA
jgi:hypothetical protein